MSFAVFRKTRPAIKLKSMKERSSITETIYEWKSLAVENMYARRRGSFEQRLISVGVNKQAELKLQEEKLCHFKSENPWSS